MSSSSSTSYGEVASVCTMPSSSGPLSASRKRSESASQTASRALLGMLDPTRLLPGGSAEAERLGLADLPAARGVDVSLVDGVAREAAGARTHDLLHLADR